MTTVLKPATPRIVSATAARISGSESSPAERVSSSRDSSGVSVSITERGGTTMTAPSAWSRHRTRDPEQNSTHADLCHEPLAADDGSLQPRLVPGPVLVAELSLEQPAGQGVAEVDPPGALDGRQMLT